MANESRPVVLVVDDHPDDGRPEMDEWRRVFSVTICHPQDVRQDHLVAADVIVVDYVIENWDERERASSIALRPINGLALTAVLRQQTESIESRLRAFVLRSGHLAKLSGGFPPQPRGHILAAAHDLEWAVPKGERATDIVRQIDSLALAVRLLPGKWPVDDFEATRGLVERLLALPNSVRWSGQAWNDIQNAHAPIHSPLDDLTQSRVFLRWLLHRIFPYPCFLWDSERLALRLRVRHQSLQRNLEGLRAALAESEYSGCLKNFLGLRWWRSGIEALLWDLTKGEPTNPDATREALNKKFGVELQPLTLKNPVICFDENIQPLAEPCDADGSVRIEPDDWPAFADQAWTSRKLAKEHPSLGALVPQPDREYLET